MKYKKHFFLLLIPFVLLCTSCSSFPSNINSSFRNFTLNVFQQDVCSTTLGLHYSVEHPENYGITETPITLGNFDTSVTDSMAVIENYQAALAYFPYNSLSDENQLTYDVFSSYLETAAKGTKYQLYEEPLSPITGIHAQLPVLLAEYRLESKSDVTTYLKLLETLPDYFSSLTSFEQKKSDAGLFMPDYNAEEVISQCNAFCSMGESNYLLSTFEERIKSIEGLTTEDCETFIAQNKNCLENQVIPAYKQLISVMEKLKGTGTNEQGLCYYPDGKEYYAFLVERDIGSGRTMEETKNLLEKQIASDLLGMQKLLSKTDVDIEVDKMVAFHSPELILNDLKTKTNENFPTAPEVNMEIKYVPKALEPYLSPAFYFTPAIDNAMDNTIYINQAQVPENLYLFTTLAHEGYPGHLYQSTYYTSKKPDPLRLLFSFKGYVEGWATYAEMCSYYFTNLEKSYTALTQQNNSLILGLYAMADYGIHYEGWNLERTTQFYNAYGITDAETIQNIYELIIGDPANYLTYYLGYVEILELKREVMQTEGKNFSQKDFHQKLLDVGPASFEIVYKYVLENK